MHFAYQTGQWEEITRPAKFWGCWRSEKMAAGKAARKTGKEKRADLAEQIALMAVPELVDLFLSVFFGYAVTLLEQAAQFFHLALSHNEIIISKFAPLLFHLALDLLPIALQLILVHGSVLHLLKLRAGVASLRRKRKQLGCQRIRGSFLQTEGGDDYEFT
jgi:NAD/NADP transhydrogenase beta subunit